MSQLNYDDLLLIDNVTPKCLNYRFTVIAQYANSPNLLSLTRSLYASTHLCKLFDDFYRKIWDLNSDEITDLGLDIWGQIVGVNRTFKAITGFFWGFNEETLLMARPSHDDSGYNDTLSMDDKETAIGMFRDDQSLYTDLILSNEAYSKYILVKAGYNISDMSTPNLNKLLMQLFGGNGKIIYVKDNMNMTMTIVVNWILNIYETNLFLNAADLFRPVGVDLDIKVSL